jgi:hypothetical protein
LKNIVVVPIVWKSWLWRYFKLSNKGQRRVTLQARLDAMPLFDVMCNCAFWMLPRTFIVKLAAQYMIRCASAWSLLQCLFHVISEHMHLGPDAVMNIISKRLHLNDLGDAYAPTLLELDEALEVLDQDDRKKVVENQENVVKKMAERSNFARDFKAKRVDIRVAEAKAKAKAKAKPKAAPKAFKFESVVELEEAKKLVPQGASVWHGYTRREWCGHHAVSGARRIQASWDMPGGEVETIRNILQRLWLQHSEWCGIELVDLLVPVGLFLPAVAPAAPVVAA